MRVLYLGLWLVTDFFSTCFFLHFSSFLIILLFYKLYIAIINHKQRSMPSKEEWFTYDTTVFLHLINHIHNQRKEMQERKTRKWWTFTARDGISGHHLQPRFSPVMLFFHTDLSLGNMIRSRTPAQTVVLTLDCSRNACRSWSLHPVCHKSVHC